jgi:hypothetical protein
MILVTGATGQFGNTTIDFLKRTLCSIDYTIEDTSISAHSGDIRVSKGEFECIIDSKLYKQSVPKKEVEKLKRDMSDKNIRCGMIVSLTSGISGMKPIDIDFFTNDNDNLCCIIALANLQTEPDRFIVSLKLLELLYDRVLKTIVVNTCSTTKEKSKEIFEDVYKSAEELNELIKSFEKHKKAVNESLETFHQQLLRAIVKHISRVEERVKSI